MSAPNDIFYRALPMHSVDYAVARCPSVRPSHRYWVSRLYISSHFLRHRLAPPSL